VRPSRAAGAGEPARAGAAAEPIPCPSPNHGPRRGGGRIDFLILHYTGMESAAAALARLCDPAAQVSAHYLIDEDGRTYRLVDEDRRAWHAGLSGWADVADINSRSVGIELANPGHELGYRSFPEAQMASLVGLCRGILARHPIPPGRVLGHSDVAPLRKRDPGERFDWRRLAGAGIGLWPRDAAWRSRRPTLLPGARGPAVADLRRRLAGLGYAIAPGEAYDRALAASVAALQRHWRPARVDGFADQETQAVLADLLDQHARSA
jgi:N-acetylmuramoyl-L-alanine amidase